MKQTWQRTQATTQKLDLEKRGIADAREKSVQKQKALVEKKLQEGEDMILFREVLRSYAMALEHDRQEAKTET